MPFTAELLTTELIQQLRGLVQRRLPAERAPLVNSFIAELYDKVPPADLIAERLEHLYAAGVSLYNFASTRRPGELKIRVYNPRLDEHGWHTPHTIIEVVNDDMPFLVDSVAAELTRQHIDIQLVAHPIFSLRRNDKGELVEVGPAEATPVQGAQTESIMHLRVRAQPPEYFATLEAKVKAVLGDVRAAVEDFAAMRSQCAEQIARLETLQLPVADEDRLEVIEFLKWLNVHHFTYVGYRYCKFEERETSLAVKATNGNGLGILRDPQRKVFEDFQPAQPLELLRIFKANERSTVHRPVHLDAVVLTDVLDGAEPGDFPRCGAHMFIGLFTLSAYTRSTDNIPLIRQKVRRAVERSGFLPQSHDGKTLRYILETYPRDELLQVSVDTLLGIAKGILHLQHRKQVAFFARNDPFGRFVSCLVYIPRDRMDTNLRLRLQEIIAKAYHGRISAYYTRFTDEPLARLHLIIKTPSVPTVVDHQALERRLMEATRSWEDRLETALINELGEEVGVQRARIYGNAFPASYREAFDEFAAVSDVEFIQDGLEQNDLTVQLYRPVEAPPHQLRLKVFVPSGSVTLSDIVPKLENMGLRVVGEVPYWVRPEGVDIVVRLHDFIVVTEDEVPVELARVRAPFVDVFTQVWRGIMADDGFNKLVLHAGLSAREVKLLRAYAKYLKQLQFPFSLSYMQQTLKRYPNFASALVAFFRAKFDPHFTAAPVSERSGSNGHRRSKPVGAEDPSRQAVIGQLQAAALQMIDSVDNLDEDRILHAFLNTVDATLRTNFFQPDEDGQEKEYVSIKLDCDLLRHMPRPKPFREIFVYSPRMEGVHLRFGHVARGGLRWSDRREDFRTEVLSLVKAQRVKNSVIVPVGSKGGFVVQQPPSSEQGRDALQAEGIAAYRTFIQGMLDITDNRQGERIEPPANVVIHDGPDPYLVVAADKGTATFSDIANQLSHDYHFWLDDAFASGGSAGYDHKKMGITARGAWESVKRHFRELGKDIQREDFTCVGVGDMSGDVFGNGMLLSKHTRLVGAFNHLHIFIDPDPDPAVSWRERRRLFELPRSSWADYDHSLISRGGGVFDRKAKTIPLSPEIQRLLDLQAAELTPTELIHALLLCRVELLFFGGIGTYVKSRHQSHGDVGDRANDALRVDGHQLRAEVVGEGANLGMTQAGRIEYALQGGRCFTDFIDNSAGVDCSDHEVNLKILLGEVERAGDMTRKQRNDLLAQMTDEVASLVLRDNYLQTQSLTVTHHIGHRLTDRLARFMRALERAQQLDRALEYLPDEESLSQRTRTKVSFTRPELAVLLSYSKNSLYEALLGSDVPEQPFLDQDLMAYFPRPIQDRFAEQARHHQLRREIIATVVANDVINRVGITFVYEACELTGASPANVTKAYVVAREVLQMRPLWSAIEKLDDRLIAPVQASMLIDCGRAITSFTMWLLHSYGSTLEIAAGIEDFESGVHWLMTSLRDILPEQEREELTTRSRQRQEKGAPVELADRVALLPLLAPAGDIVQIGREVDCAIETVAELYFLIGARFGLSWLRRLARRLPAERSWDRQALAAVVEDLYATQRLFTATIFSSTSSNQSPAAMIEEWSQERMGLVQRNAQLTAELQSASAPNFAMLAVANGQLKAMLVDARKPGTPPSVIGAHGFRHADNGVD